MDDKLEAVKNAILIRGIDDWVHIAEVADIARQVWFGERLLVDYPVDGASDGDWLTRSREEWLAGQERQALPLGVRAIKDLLRDGLIRVGEVRDTFVPWEGSLVERESLIDTQIERATFPVRPGDLFWIENTLSGDEKAATASG